MWWLVRLLGTDGSVQVSARSTSQPVRHCGRRKDAPPLPHPSARREGSQEHEGSREGGAWAGRGGEDDVVLVSIRGFREPRKQL